MRRPVLAVLILIVSLFCFCNKKQKPDETAIPEAKSVPARTFAEPDVTTENPGGAGEAVAAVFYIKACLYEPEKPTAFDDLTAVPVLNEEFSSDESILQKVSYQYRWIVNKTEITEINESKLPKAFFKKKDWVQCRVRAVYLEKQTPEFRGNLVRIQNSPPTMNIQPLPDIKIPGEFRYSIPASDADKDPLTFSLIAPLDAGIEIDPQTGLIVWPISVDMANTSAKTEIIFAVSDADGGTAQGSIIINFQSKEIEKQ